MELNALLAMIFGEIALVELLLLLAGRRMLRKSRETSRHFRAQLKAVSSAPKALDSEDFVAAPMRAPHRDSKQIALDFINRQAHESHLQLARDESLSEADQLAWKARKHYLKLEGQALSGHQENSQEYKDCLASGLIKFVELFSRGQRGTLESEQLQERVELLRARLDHIKGVEQEVSDNRVKLKSSQERVEQLERLLKRAGCSVNETDTSADSNGNNQLPKTSASDQTVAAFTSKIRKQRELIEELSQKLAESHDIHKQSDTDVPDEEIENMRAHVASLEEELQEAEGIIDSLNVRIRKFRPRDTLASDARQESDIRIFGAREHDDEDRQAEIELARQEIERLNEYIDRQKETIAKFSEELSKLRLDLVNSVTKDEAEERSKSIQRLERMLTESETCIGMLEDQVDDLREQLHSFDLEDFDADNDGIPETDNGKLQGELKSVETMLDTTMKAYADQSTLTKFMMSGLECKSHYELGSKVLQYLLEFGVEAVLNISVGKESIEVYDKNRINVFERNQLKRIDPLTRDRITSVPAGVVITYPKVQCLLKISDIDQERFTEIQDMATSMIALTHVLIQKLSSDGVIKRQKKSLDQLMTTTKKTVMDVDVQYKFQASEATQTIDRFMKDVYMAVNSMDLNEDDREIFTAMINECQERMALLFATGMSIDNTLKGLLDSLERKV